jgi:MFS family permease
MGGARNHRWYILGVGFLCMFAWFVTLQSIPPLIPLIINELGIGHLDAGWLMSIITMPGIIIAILSGLMADRYDKKLIITVSFILMMIGISVSASGDSLSVMLLGRFIAGIGGAPLFVLGPQIVGQWFEGKELGLALGTVNAGAPVGTIVAMNMLPTLAINFGWRGSLWLSLLIPVFSLVIFWLIYKKPACRPEYPKASFFNMLKENKLVSLPVLLLGFSMLLFNASFMSLLTFTPDFVITSGVNLAIAGMIGSAAMWPGVLFSSFVGYVGDRTGMKRSMVVYGAIFMAIFIFLIPKIPAIVLPLVLLAGTAKTLIPPPIFTMTYENSHVHNSGLSYGIIQSMSSLGLVIGPPLTGWTRDLSGSYDLSFGLISGIALLIPLCMLFLWLLERGKRKQISIVPM